MKKNRFNKKLYEGFNCRKHNYNKYDNSLINHEVIVFPSGAIYESKSRK